MPVRHCEEGDGERVCHPDILGRAQRQVGDGEARGAIQSGGIRNGAGRSSPVYGRKLEWDIYLKITAVGPLAVLVQAVVAGEIGVPLQGQGTEVVAYVGFEEVVGAMGVVLEVAACRDRGPR